MSDVILKVCGLEKSYDGLKAVKNVSFDLDQGEVLVLLGPSGCGKSTTLRLVAGLEEPDSGEISIRGKVVVSVSRQIFVPAEKRNLGLVFQSYAIWPHMTVGQNIAYPLEISRAPREKIRARVEWALNLVGLDGFETRRTTQLSGGQQQRVALARAVVYEPDILLLDEPLSNLDANLRAEMRLQIKALQRRLGTTILYVTHDQVEAMALASRVVVMREGEIEQIGTPYEIYESPSTFFVQSFVGRVLNLPAVVARMNGETYLEIQGVHHARVELDNVLPEGTEARLTVRPEDVIVEPLSGGEQGGALRGIIEDIIYCGDHMECALRVGEAQLLCDAPKDTALKRGQEVVLSMKPRKGRVWPVPGDQSRE